jgi:hypothetical protein
MPPVPTWTHLPACWFSAPTVYPLLCIWSQGRRKNVAWHSTVHYSYICIRACTGFCLINRSTAAVNHAEPGAQFGCDMMLLVPFVFHQASSANITLIFHLHTYPQLEPHQTLCPQSSIFPGLRHVLIVCLHVLEL